MSDTPRMIAVPEELDLDGLTVAAAKVLIDDVMARHGADARVVIVPEAYRPVRVVSRRPETERARDLREEREADQARRDEEYDRNTYARLRAKFETEAAQ